VNEGDIAMNQQGRLQGQVAFITGGGRGIGAAAARTVAREGGSVCLVARSDEETRQVAEDIRKNGGNAVALSADVSDFSAIKAAVDTCVEQLGGLDILLLGAGVVLQRDCLEDCDPALWAKTININLTGAFNTAYAAIPHLKARGGGKIITLGSGRGRRAASNISDYACSKAGLWMLTRTLAAELGRYHIAANEIVPGPVMTKMNTAWGNQTDPVFLSGEEYVKTEDEVMPLLLFLLEQCNETGPTGQTFSLNRREI